jgi:hypothetical protein
MQPATLRERLARIAPHTPGTGAKPASPELRQLMERIERLRRTARSRHTPPHADAMSESLGATTLEPGLLLIERRFPAWHRHGRMPISALRGVFLGDGSGTRVHGRFVYLDTETTGLAGGTGTIAFMVGLAHLDADALVVRQYLITAFGAERAMLQRVTEALGAAAIIVSFNGKSFDVPLLATRLRLHGLRSPLPSLTHVDALHLLRRAHGARLPDCRLKTAEQALLGFARRDDLLGSEAPEVWRRLIRDGDASQVARLAQHNRDDLLSLAALHALLLGPTVSTA